MAKIAIDVALLLPDRINNICIGINRKAGADAFSDLSKNNNHPHITLAMGVIDESDLPEVQTKLEYISKQFSSLKLEITGIYFEITPESKKSYGFVVELTNELKRLHWEIMKELLPIFSYGVDKKMFFLDSDENFNEVSKYWVDNYGKKHLDPNNYYPHISLKCKKASYDGLPIKFSASRLAVCQLGNYCTCRKIFASIDLG